MNKIIPITLRICCLVFYGWVSAAETSPPADLLMPRWDASFIPPAYPLGRKAYVMMTREGVIKEPMEPLRLRTWEGLELPWGDYRRKDNALTRLLKTREENIPLLDKIGDFEQYSEWVFIGLLAACLGTAMIVDGQEKPESDKAHQEYHNIVVPVCLSSLVASSISLNYLLNRQQELADQAVSNYNRAVILQWKMSY